MAPVKKKGFSVPDDKFSENWQLLKKELHSTLKDVPLKSNKKLQKRKPKRKVSNEQDEPTPSSSQSHIKSGPLGIDCEFVGVGIEGVENMLARVSIVDWEGTCIYDTFVRASQNVVDWRTQVSGVRPANLKNAPEFTEVQEKVRTLISGHLLVGHGLRSDLKIYSAGSMVGRMHKHFMGPQEQYSDADDYTVTFPVDLDVLRINHPRSMIRDTAKFALFRRMTNSKKTPSLKKLAHDILGIQAQQNEHDSIQDARIAMRLYQMHKQQWKKEDFSRRRERNTAATANQRS